MIIISNSIETRPSVIKNLSNDVKYITHMQNVLAKKLWKCTQKDDVKIIWHP